MKLNNRQPEGITAATMAKLLNLHTRTHTHTQNQGKQQTGETSFTVYIRPRGLIYPTVFIKREMRVHVASRVKEEKNLCKGVEL